MCSDVRSVSGQESLAEAGRCACPPETASSSIHAVESGVPSTNTRGTARRPRRPDRPRRGISRTAPTPAPSGMRVCARSSCQGSFKLRLVQTACSKVVDAWLQPGPRRLSAIAQTQAQGRIRLFTQHPKRTRLFACERRRKTSCMTRPSAPRGAWCGRASKGPTVSERGPSFSLETQVADAPYAPKCPVRSDDLGWSIERCIAGSECWAIDLPGALSSDHRGRHGPRIECGQGR